MAPYVSSGGTLDDLRVARALAVRAESEQRSHLLELGASLAELGGELAAVTRAMQTLNLSHCSARKKYGQLAPCHPSQFLRELPAELVEQAALCKNERATLEIAKDWFTQIRAAAR